MPRVGFEPTIPASKRAKTVHASFQLAACFSLVTRPTIHNNKNPVLIGTDHSGRAV
jgi:hypothetical protein